MTKFDPHALRIGPPLAGCAKPISILVLAYLLCSSQLAFGEGSIDQQESEDNLLLHQTNGSFDFGIGLGGADIPDNAGIGWDFLGGYEWLTSGNWRIGGQLHYLNGVLLSDTSFQSLGLFVTARPENKWLQWIQFKTGFVSDNYSTTMEVVTFNPYPYYTWQKQTVSWSGTGAAIGAGITIDNGNWSAHLLDVERHFISGHSFNTYTISIAIFLH